MNDWHIWTIATNRYKKILNYLQEADFVEDFLYPVAEKEYNTKKGKRKKDVPIYANYMFIKYNHNVETLMALDEFPWLLQRVGCCTLEEIERIRGMDKSSYDEIIPEEELDPGTKVKMVQTPFAGWDAEIVEQSGEKLLVSIKIFGGERIIKCTVEDINVIE